jgi:hypothetical protein
LRSGVPAPSLGGAQGPLRRRRGVALVQSRNAAAARARAHATAARRQRRTQRHADDENTNKDDDRCNNEREQASFASLQGGVSVHASSCARACTRRHARLVCAYSASAPPATRVCRAHDSASSARAGAAFPSCTRAAPSLHTRGAAAQHAPIT